MAATVFVLFDTPIGECGVAWSDQGIAAVQLPEPDPDGARRRLLSARPSAIESAPPQQVRDAIEGMTRLLQGERVDLSAVILDPAGVPPFHLRVYDVARTIPPGTTLTYGDIAARLGDPGSARAVGQALGRNPFAIIVPCHRVLASGGRVGGFSAAGGSATKLRILAIEGAIQNRLLFER